MFNKNGLVKRVPGLAGSNLIKRKSISVDLKHVQTIFSHQICLTYHFDIYIYFCFKVLTLDSVVICH